MRDCRFTKETDRPKLQESFVSLLAGVALASLLGCGSSAKSLMPESPARDERPKARLALTPPMGFNNWNAFGCDVNETLIKEAADFFVSSGLKDAGYTYVNIDDCWSAKKRDEAGRLLPDPVKFPSGISGVADYVHGLGLKLGIYGDAGTKTCAGYPGSLGNEVIDAETFADWGVDYLKYDNCYSQSDGSREDFVRRYTAMRDAINATGRPIVYSICEWGQSKPWEWAADVGHLWRTTGDISDNWSSIRDIIGVNTALAQYAGPGHWNDPDMLEIGNGGLSAVEQRTQMSMWSMMAAPLLIGTDLRKASAETLSILSHHGLISIDQDPLGQQAAVVDSDAGLWVLKKRLFDGQVAVALYNSSDAQALVSAEASAVGLQPADAYYLYDLWGESAVESQKLVAAGVPAHGTLVFRARALRASDRVPPALSVEGALPTLIPGVADGTTLLTRVTNRGVDSADHVSVSVDAPGGWAVTAQSAANGDSLATDATLETTWTVRAPEGTTAGLYPLTVRAAYAYGEGATPASAESELVAAVAVAPPDGETPLSTVRALNLSNGLGPVEIDTSNGGAAPGDGNLITIGGRVYTRGLGTHAPSSLVYYLGGRCSRLSVDVGIDDEVGEGGAATFSIRIDGVTVKKTKVLTGSDPATRLDADLTGASVVELAVSSEEAPLDDHADWAAPRVVCGESTEPTIVERTLFSFESGVEQFTIAHASDGGSVAPSTGFATEGEHGLFVQSPPDGNWFGRRFAAPLDLRAFSSLRYDVETGKAGTPGEFALEVGPERAWCQGGKWTWTNVNSKKTISRRFDEIDCPRGVTMDPSQIHGIWIFLKNGAFTIDNVRAEQRRGQAATPK